MDGVPVSEAKTVIATVSGDDLLKALNAVTVQVTEVKTIVSNIPGQIVELQKDVSAMKIWKAKITGAVSLMGALLTGGTVTALIAIFAHVKGT